METANFLPYISGIKRNSIHDGPGIRTVVFFKGCPLNCVWCHNPEMIRKELEISFNQDKCIKCFNCQLHCPKNITYPFTKKNIKKSTCDFCGKCEEHCLANIIKITGKKMSPEALVQELLRDLSFFKNSGGGVTFSGGEPALYTEYISEVVKILKASSIHVNIETAGYFKLEKFLEKLFTQLNLVFFDLKLMDSHKHTQYTGIDNEVIIKNLIRLIELEKEKVKIRVPLIPDITATKKNLYEIASFLTGLGVGEVIFLRYNPLYSDKSKSLGFEPPTIRKNLSDEEVQSVKEIFSTFSYKIY